jgi:hypothetical protein
MKISRLLFLVAPTLVLVGCGGGAPKPAATADAAVMQMVDSMQKNQPEGLWDMLPSSYQTEANETLHRFADKMPADMYNQGTGLLQKLEKVLKTKKDLILENPMLEESPVDISESYDQMVAVLSAFTSSDLMSVEKMKSADIGQLVASIGGELMDVATRMDLEEAASTGELQEMLEFKQTMASVKAELISEDGDSAVVRISAVDEDPEEVEFVKVEGKWIPADLAEGWSEMIAEFKSGVEEMEITPEQASQVKMGITMVGSILDQLQAAETQEDLEMIIGGALGMLMMGF